MLKQITVHGARQHNLKNIDVAIPRNTLTVITGLSGSGKSSLAFDTIYAEGQRRYVETLSPYARQFLDQMERPEVDSIDGLEPGDFDRAEDHQPQSALDRGDDHRDLRLSARAVRGDRRAALPQLRAWRFRGNRREQILQQVMALGPQERVMILAPIVRGRKGEYKKELEKLARQGFVRARVDGVLRPLDEEITLDKRKNHTIEVVVDRLLIKPEVEKRLEASIETATKLADGLVLVAWWTGRSGCTRRNWRVRNAARACRNWSRARFRSTVRLARARPARGWGAAGAWDPAKVIVDPSKPLLDGALGPGGSSAYVSGRFEAAGGAAEDSDPEAVREAAEEGAGRR